MAEIGQLFKMDYSAVSQAAKRFEQKNNDNHKIGEIKQKMMAALKENRMSNVETLPINFRLLNLA